jgi:hypothetical protein
LRSRPSATSAAEKSLLPDHELERQVEQQVAQLVPDRTDLALSQRMVELEDLLDEVWAQRFPRLGAVPWTPMPEVPDHRERTSKR